MGTTALTYYVLQAARGPGRPAPTSSHSRLLEAVLTALGVRRVGERPDSRP